MFAPAFSLHLYAVALCLRRSCIAHALRLHYFLLQCVCSSVGEYRTAERWSCSRSSMTASLPVDDIILRDWQALSYSFAIIPGVPQTSPTEDHDMTAVALRLIALFNY